MFYIFSFIVFVSSILGPLADYLVINVSSPNTPGLRKLQGKQEFEGLISHVMEARNQYLTEKIPILVKIEPDLSPQDKLNISDLIMNNPNCKIDGLIVSNTTNSRPHSLKSSLKNEIGGLSGKPLKNLATQTISDMYKLTNGNYRFFWTIFEKLEVEDCTTKIINKNI